MIVCSQVLARDEESAPEIYVTKLREMQKLENLYCTRYFVGYQVDIYCCIPININASLRHRQKGPMAIGIPNSFYRRRRQLWSRRNRQLRPSQSASVLRHDTKHPSADGGHLSSRRVLTTSGLLSALRYLAACEAHRSAVDRARPALC